MAGDEVEVVEDVVSRASSRQSGTVQRAFRVIAVGAVVLLVGMLVHAAYAMMLSDTSAYDDYYEYNEYRERRSELRGVALVEDVFLSVGVIVIALGMLYGAFFASELGDGVRAGMLIAVAILLGLLSAGMVAPISP